VAQSYITDSGSQLYVPGTYVNQEVKTQASNIGTAGVLTLIGEADEGPDFSLEADLSDVVYTPDQYGYVVSKFGSGRIVEAFAHATKAANDPAITGAVQAIRIVKTNKSTPATLSVTKAGFGGYADLAAKKFGYPGNLVKIKSTVSQNEIAPKAEGILYAPNFAAASTFGLRPNGAAVNTVSVNVKMIGSDLAAAINSIDLGILATGGKVIKPLTGLGALTKTISTALVSGFTDRLTITLQSGSIFSTVPVEGQTLIIPDSDFGVGHVSAIKGTSSVNNAGAYVVVQVVNTASNASITVKKLSGPAGAVIGVASGVVNAADDDIILFSNINISNKTGMDRQATVGLTGTFTTVSNDGANVVVSVPTGFVAQPKAGDIVKYLTAFAGVNAGFYEVVSSTINTVNLVRLSDGSAGATGSANVVVAITQSTQPFLVLKPEIDGVGKTLEFIGDVEAIFLDKSTYAGASLSNKMLVSASEKKMAFLVSKGTQQSTYTIGGDVVVQIGCSQENSFIKVLADRIEFYKSSTLAFTCAFNQFKILKDLVDFINSKKDFTAAVTLAKYTTFACSALPKGTFTISVAGTSKSCLLKKDAYDFKTIVGASPLISVSMVGEGLPEVITPDQFLDGGSKGGTTSADFIAAIEACKKLDLNFIVPLISQDADADILEGETESSSTYVIEAVNQYLSGHVIEMSTEKRMRNRSAIGSIWTTYDLAKEAANNLANFRFGLAFEKVRNPSVDGTIKTFQPWYAAVNAAAMQLAAGYKGIVKKGSQITGLISPAGFDYTNPGDQEDALKAGLLFMERVPTGGFRWVSDQTTYSIDNNFVYNSLQAVYVSDLMALTLKVRFDRAIVGKSVAEVSAASAKSLLETEMFNFLRLRWIAPSDDAVKGYKNVSIKLTGGVMRIAFEAKIAGLIYFVPVAMAISQVEQTA
jgi:hypothetical protein